MSRVRKVNAAGRVLRPAPPAAGQVAGIAAVVAGVAGLWGVWVALIVAGLLVVAASTLREAGWL